MATGENPGPPSGPEQPDYRRLFESAPGLYLVLTPDFDIVCASDAYLRATMTRREDITGRNIFDVFPDDPNDPHATGEKNLRESLARVRSEHVPDVMAIQRYPVRRSDAAVFEERFWSPANYPVVGDDGELDAIIHRVEDVTEFIRLRGLATIASEERPPSAEYRRRSDEFDAELFRKAQQIQSANRQLREANEQLSELRRQLEMTAEQREVLLQSVVDTVLDGIITIDSRGTIQSFNRSAESIFGYDAAEMIGRNVRDLMPEPYHSEHDGYVARYLRTGEARIIGIGREVTGLRKDGTTFPMDLSVSRFELAGEIRFTGLVRDITSRKKMETQLQMAERMDAMGRLAAGVAHDFNNLLTVISGYSELVLNSLPQSHDCRPLVGEIRGASRRASSLTRQLLAASRQQVLEPRVIDINEVIVDTASMLRRLIGEDIELETILHKELPQVKADPGQIGQVILNLAVNARDAMPEGGRLTIRTFPVDVDPGFAVSHPPISVGRHVMIAVTDTGKGMPREVLNRVFEPFFTTKEIGKGTGLGLSVVHGIVKQSGGAVDVYSEVGVGTVFKLYLPAIDQPLTQRTRSAFDIARGQETILLVEDDRSVRALAAMCLQQAGYVVLQAATGPQAVDLIERHDGRVDLMLTDVVMPGMGGRRLVEIVRERWPQIRVVFMSGYTDDAVVRQGVLQADIEFLQKPFTPTLLTRKVRDVLDS